jgi:hypothetical protein
VKNLWVKRIDNSGGSGIIREDSKKPITEITDKAIDRVSKVEISGYTDEQCEFIQPQHKELLKYSRDNNENKEVAFVFRGDFTSKEIYTGSSDNIEFGALYDNDLFVMHNHPRNSSFSTLDIKFFGNCQNLKTLTIVKNNGEIEYITKSEKFDLQKFRLEYDRLERKIVKNGSNTEKDKLVRTLLNKTKAGVIWSGKV